MGCRWLLPRTECEGDYSQLDYSIVTSTELCTRVSWGEERDGNKATASVVEHLLAALAGTFRPHVRDVC